LAIDIIGGQAGSTMSFLTGVRRSLGGGDARFWRIPGFIQLQLRGDAGPRAGFAALVGLGAGGPMLAILLALAPPGQVLWATAMGVALVFLFAFIAFLWEDAVSITVKLDDDCIRRRTKPVLFNLFGARTRTEEWDYRSLTGCGYVADAGLGSGYAAWVLAQPGHAATLLVPQRIDVQQTTAFLASRGVRAQALAAIPPQAVPPCSVGPRGIRIASILAGAALLLTLGGGLARLAIHGPGKANVDLADVGAALAAAPPRAATRELTGLEGGAKGALVSPDGRWVWAQSATGKHLIWNDKQDAPAGELTLPAGQDYRVAFTPDSTRLIAAGGSEAHVWQLDPLQAVRTIPLQEPADALLTTADGRQLIVVTLTVVQLYDLETGMPAARYPSTLGAVVCAGLSADGARVVIVQQPRIIAVNLGDGAVEELVAYSDPPHFSNGNLSPGAKFAALQGAPGTVVFDLASKQQRPALATGPIYVVPVITADGATIAVPGGDGVGLWNVAGGSLTARLTGSAASYVSLSADGRRLIGWRSNMPVISVWDLPE
jgi:hypothetical protein